MIRLRDSILINVSPDRVWSWLNELPVHYRTWHPAHVTCRYEGGDRLQVGATLYVEERLHQRMHRLRLRACEVVPGRLLRYRGRGFEGAFVLEPVAGGTRFTAELAFGVRARGLGGLVDVTLRPILARVLPELQAHMREEGENLKRILEHDARSATGA